MVMLLLFLKLACKILMSFPSQRSHGPQETCIWLSHKLKQVLQAEYLTLLSLPAQCPTLMHPPTPAACKVLPFSYSLITSLMR